MDRFYLSDTHVIASVFLIYDWEAMMLEKVTRHKTQLAFFIGLIILDIFQQVNFK